MAFNKKIVHGIYILNFLFFLCNSMIFGVVTTQQIQQVQELVEVLKNLNALAPSEKQASARVKSITPSSSPTIITPSAMTNPAAKVTPPIQTSTPPIALLAFNVNGSKCSAPFTVVSVGAGAAYNATALSCSGGLQLINIALTDANVTDWSASLTISDNVLSNSVLIKLMQQGMYIAINMMQNPANNPAGNYIQINLTDVSGNLYAQSPLVQLPAGIGFAYANVGFNVLNTQMGMNSNQTYVNWMPIVNGQAIFYKDQGSATTVTTPGIGGQVSTPPATKQSVSTGLTPPATPIAATQALQWLDVSGFGDLPNDWPATATSNAALGSWPVATIQNNTPSSCAQGLQTLYVDLMNAAGTGVLNCQFTISASPILQQLAQQGLYVAVQISNVNVSAGTSTITVFVTDISGNVFAATAANLASSVGATYICVGFNMNPYFYGELMNPSGSTQTAVNLVKILDSSRIFYKDQGSATTVTTPIFGGITVPV